MEKKFPIGTGMRHQESIRKIIRYEELLVFEWGIERELLFDHNKYTTYGSMGQHCIGPPL